jgi:hypothetical protein
LFACTVVVALALAADASVSWPDVSTTASVVPVYVRAENWSVVAAIEQVAETCSGWLAFMAGVQLAVAVT